jgi:hypothetical protein
LQELIRLLIQLPKAKQWHY